jgi:hypothetical protein
VCGSGDRAYRRRLVGTILPRRDDQERPRCPWGTVAVDCDERVDAGEARTGCRWSLMRRGTVGPLAVRQDHAAQSAEDHRHPRAEGAGVLVELVEHDEAQPAEETRPAGPVGVGVMAEAKQRRVQGVRGREDEPASGAEPAAGDLVRLPIVAPDTYRRVPRGAEPQVEKRPGDTSTASVPQARSATSWSETSAAAG